MTPTYSHVTFAAVKQQLANRLYDPAKKFWSDGELGVYIIEALRTWNALTTYWRDDFVFPSQQSTTWYDLTDASTMPNTLRPYAMTDVDLYTAIQYHLLEPVVPINPWLGVSAQFAPDDLVNAVQRRRDELLSVTGCTITRRVIGAVAGRTVLPDTIIDVRRVAYLPASVGKITDSFSRPNQNPINTNWRALGPSAGFISGQIFNNQFVGIVVPTPGAMIANVVYDGGITWGDDQSSKATLHAFAPNTGTALLLVRHQISVGGPGALPNGLALVIFSYLGGGGFGFPSVVQISQFFGNAETILASGTVTPQIDDTFMIRASGSTVTCYRNDVPIPGLSNIATSVISGGRPGIGVNFVRALTDIGWTNWEGGGAISGRASVVWPEDVWAEQSFNRSYLQQPQGTPATYILSTEPPISFDTDAAPPPGGNYELLTVEAGAPLTGILAGVSAADNFNRANENPLASPWTSVTAYSRPQLINNATSPLSTAVQVNLALYSGVVWSPDQSVRATIKQLRPLSGYLALVLRCDPAGLNFYYLNLDASAGFGGIGLSTPLNLQKIVNGVAQGPPYHSFGYVTPQVGDVLQMQVAGNTISAVYNGVLMGSFTDTVNPILVGSAGIFLQSALGITSVEDISLDNWEGGGTFGTSLSVPDDWTHVIKWGALADLLSRESNAKDDLRAAYCEQRYRMGLALLSAAPALLAMRIGNVPMQIDAVRGADLYQTTWQAAPTGTPETALQAGLNKVALSPAANAGPYSLTATVVRNAPVPSVDGDSLQVSRDDIDVILDYAQHLAAFKMGGQEFLATVPLLQRFMKKAEVYGLKLAELGEYTSVIYALSQREEQMNPRMAPAPSEDANG
jgi:hypothetical protein